jgi:hypothetical protein
MVLLSVGMCRQPCRHNTTTNYNSNSSHRLLCQDVRIFDKWCPSQSIHALRSTLNLMPNSVMLVRWFPLPISGLQFCAQLQEVHGFVRIWRSRRWTDPEMLRARLYQSFCCMYYQSFCYMYSSSNTQPYAGRKLTIKNEKIDY